MKRSDVHFASGPDLRSIACGKPRIGDMIGVYRLERVRSESAGAIVYEGVHLGLGCGLPVAIKVHRTTDPRSVEGLRGAVRRIGRFGGPHIVRLFDVGVLPTQEPYVAMDLLEGQSIDVRMEHEGALPIGAAVDVVIQLCQGLEAPHRHSIIHGDLNPSTVVIRKAAEGGVQASLLGFDRPGRCSPGYASPEQLGSRADVDARTDVWALGILLYEMITATRAFPVHTLEEMRLAALSRTLPTMMSPRGRVPEELQSIIRQCTAIHRTSRFASTKDLARALAPFSSANATTAPARPKSATTLPSRQDATLDDDDFRRTTVRPPFAADEKATVLCAPLETKALPPLLGAPQPPAGEDPRVSTLAMARPLPQSPRTQLLPPMRSTAPSGSYPPPRCSSLRPSDAPAVLDPVVLGPEVLPDRRWMVAALAGALAIAAIVSASARRPGSLIASANASAAAAAAAPPPAEPTLPRAAPSRR